MKDSSRSFLSILKTKRRGRPPRSAFLKLAGRFLDMVHSMLRIRDFASPKRALVLRESVSLGEKRFVAVVEFEETRFLIGGSANSVQLLRDLSPKHRPKRDQVLTAPAALVGTR